METLHEDKRLNVGRELKGVPVLATHTDEKLGEVVEARIDPTAGRLVALVIHTSESETRALSGTDLSFEEGAVRVAERALLQTDGNQLKAEAYFTPEEMNGALVITDRGRLLGRVSEVHMAVETRRIYYRVVKSEWQRLMGGGGFLPGDVPRSYFHGNRRLIVPADAEGRYAAKPLAETA
jgi:sporulation protein YlmC with PRC-barrel domain